MKLYKVSLPEYRELGLKSNVQDVYVLTENAGTAENLATCYWHRKELTVRLVKIELLAVDSEQSCLGGVLMQ